LSALGLSSLRASARRIKPWEYSTGPRTEAGKARSSLNALKHGCRSAPMRAISGEIADTLRGFLAADSGR